MMMIDDNLRMGMMMIDDNYININIITYIYIHIYIYIYFFSELGATYYINVGERGKGRADGSMSSYNGGYNGGGNGLGTTGYGGGGASDIRTGK